MHLYIALRILSDNFSAHDILMNPSRLLLNCNNYSLLASSNPKPLQVEVTVKQSKLLLIIRNPVANPISLTSTVSNICSRDHSPRICLFLVWNSPWSQSARIDSEDRDKLHEGPLEDGGGVAEEWGKVRKFKLDWRKFRLDWIFPPPCLI